jgi:mono/diheme cytochrome c family protein
MPAASEGSAQGWRRRGARACVTLALCSLAACDLGGGGGGGAAAAPLPPRPIRIEVPEPADGVARGAVLFRDQGCRLCHGEAGQGGVANRNSETGGKINGLTLVKEGYTRKQLEERLRDGVPSVGRADRNGPTPPLRMMPYGRMLSERQVSDLADYVLSLYPKDRVTQDDWDTEPADAGPARKTGAKP